MAQTGYTPILLYASGTTGNTPSALNMTSSVLGAELALNYFDGKLFYKDASSNIQVLATKGTASVGGSNTQIQYNNSGTLGGSTLTYNNATGGFSIAAPISGTALSITGQLRTTGSSNGVYVDDRTTASSAALYMTGDTANIWVSSHGDTIKFNTAGNVTITAPSSGIPLTINGSASATVASFVGGSGASTALALTDGQTGNRVWRIANGFTGVGTFDINDQTAAATRLTISTAGNVTINQPTSGDTLSLINSSGNYWLSASDGTSVFKAYSSTGVFMGTSSNHGFGIFTNGFANQRVIIGGGGNVTINAPSSGTSLVVNATAGNIGAYIASDFSSAFAIDINSTAVTTGRVAMTFTRGGGTVKQWAIGNDTDGGSDNSFDIRDLTRNVIPFSIGTSGNVTINAPTSGNTLALAGVASGTALTVTNSTSGSGSEYFQSWSNGTDSNLFVRLNQVGASSKYALIETSTATPISFSTNSSTRVTIGAAGNVTIAAPVSGTALAITGNAGTDIATVTDGVVSLNLYCGGSQTYFGNRENANLNFMTNGTVKQTISGAGNVTINAPTSGSALVVNGSASTPPIAVTFSATAMTVNTNLSNVFTTTFTANVTTAPTISNPTDGQTINWFITQDATGSRTMTWPTSFKWPGGTAGVLSTAANSVDLLVATYRSATGFWYASLAKAFS